jgi:hypothetical protein
MTKRTALSVVAVPVLASVILLGLPGGVSAAGGGLFGPLTPALTARLSQDVNEPVIVLLKSQAGQGGPVVTGRRAAGGARHRDQAVHARQLRRRHGVRA